MITLQRLKAWLDAPQTDDDEIRRRVYLCNLVFRWGFVFLSITLLVWPFVAGSPNSEQYLFISLSLLLGLFGIKLLMNQGWVREAGYLVAALFWLTFTLAALIYPVGIVGTPFLAALTITPIIAGIVNGTVASITITILNWGVGGYLTWLDFVDPARSAAHAEDPWVRFLALMIMVSVFPLIVYVWQRNLQDALTQVRVTEQAQAETAAYRVQNEALEEAVAARTSALEQSLAREQHMAKQLALALESETQLGKMQSRIITVVSHEFRTPLSVINSSAEMLQQFYDRLSPERREVVHQRISEAVFYLNDLLTDVTLVDQAQRARIRPSYQIFAFSDLCEELTKRISREFNHPQRLHFDFTQAVKTPVRTDHVLLEQIVNNLVSNALKYSEKQTTVQVHFWLDSSQLFIEVRDEGIGIPLHEQSKIFDLFYRASNVDERRGLGLGLFIVQAISELLQGDVRLTSRGKGYGSTFEVAVPLLPNLE